MVRPPSDEPDPDPVESPAAPRHARTDERLRPPSLGWPVRVTTRSRFGRGIVTTREVRAGCVLEVAALVELPAEAEDALSLWGYVFDVDGRSAVAAGAVSFVNHSYAPNASYEVDGDLLELSALVDLPAGAEVLVNYNGDPDDDGPLWFDVAP